MSISQPKLISGRDNPQFRRFLEVRARKVRNVILVEGPKLLEEAIRSKLKIEAVAFSTSLASVTAPLDVPRLQFAAPLMKRLCDVETPQGVLALVARPDLTSEWLLEEKAFVLILDGLQDPGNVGTLFRTAEAAGVSGILLTPGCADPLSPKALRASAGSAFRVPHLPSLPPDQILRLLPPAIRLVAGVSAPGASSLFDPALPLSLPLALALGSEGSGLDPRIEAAALRVRVPNTGRVESLNVAAAGAICLFEVARRAGTLRR